MAYFRKAAGLGQQEFGEPLGWSAPSVSAAERSWDSKRIKKFDADEITQIAAVLGVPLIALFLPPEDHGTAVHYTIVFPERRVRDLDYLLNLVLPEWEGDSPAMEAYRKRLMAAGVSRDLADLVEARAQARARQLDDENRRSRMRGNEAVTRGESERVIGEARVRAATLEQDAREKIRQVMGSLPQTRDELERQVDELERRVNDLRTFERDYRTRLQTLVEGQLLELWAPELRPEMERAIEEVRRRATARKGNRVSAVLLREDGTYDVLQFPRAGEANVQQQETPTPDDGSAP
jgi:hypothetical protein